MDLWQARSQGCQTSPNSENSASPLPYSMSQPLMTAFLPHGYPESRSDPSPWTRWSEEGSHHRPTVLESFRVVLPQYLSCCCHAYQCYCSSRLLRTWGAEQRTRLRPCSRVAQPRSTFQCAQSGSLRRQVPLHDDCSSA